MENKWLYKKKYHIELSDVDFSKKLKLSSLFSYLQDVASHHVEQLGIGVNALRDKFGVAWILLRLRIDIKRLPMWNEDIYIETWHHETRKLDFERDFIIYDSNGERIISAVSTWVIIDVESRSIKRTEVLNFQYEEVKERAIDCKLGRLKSFNNEEVVYKKTVGYSDIDFNGHINNSKYVDFAMDCFPLDKHTEYRVTSVEVNYVNEALPGETIILIKDNSKLEEGLLYLEGVNEKDEKAIFKSLVEVERI